MDERERESFLASIDKELESEEEISIVYPASASSRRLSAAGNGLALRRKSLSEIGETPPKLSLIAPPPNSVPDLGQSFLTNPPPDPFAPSPTPLLTPSRLSAGPTGPTEQRNGEEDAKEDGPAADYSPNKNRSGKKRRLPSDGSDGRNKKKMAAKAGGKDDEDMFTKLAKMMKGIENKIEQSEVRMAAKLDTKIDSMTKALEERMQKTEQAVANTQAELSELKAATSEQSINILVERALSRRPAEASREPGRRPRAFGRLAVDIEEPDFSSTPARPDRLTNEAREDRYWEARRQLRVWPVDQAAGLVEGVEKFFVDKLLISETRLHHLKFTTRPLISRADSVAQDQVVVTFESVSQRDEVRAKASNLRGAEKGVGCQLEPPDHLRGQYQALQNLAFCLKKRNPELKRNIKFDDRELALIMDVKTAEGWKTIDYQAAKDILRRRTQRSNSLSRRELKGILNASDVVDSDESMEQDETVIPSKTTENTFGKRCLHSLSFLNTNARSLGPKITALADCFEEKLLDMATVTETWFQTDRLKLELAQEMVDKHALSMITRERTMAAANGRQYGGVAFVYRLETSKFEEFSIVNPEDYEILATIGRVTGVKGKIFCLSCYAPPNITLLRAREMIEYISDLVCEAKRTYEDCSIVVSGDFNQWPVEEFLEDHPDMKEVEHGPTRGHRKIDRSFTNFSRSVRESITLPPLDTEEGSVSDHKMVYTSATFQAEPKTVVSYTYRPFTEGGAANFVSQCRNQDWSAVLSAKHVDEKEEAFHSIVGGLMDANFPLRTTTRRASDPPWVNDQIRKLCRKRRRIYDREGRSKRWKRLKKKSDELYRKRAGKYVQKQFELLTGPDASRAFYKHVKAYKSKERPAAFDPCDLYPGQEPQAVAENLAEHFNRISREFTGIEPDQVPDAPHVDLPVLDCAEVATRLRGIRKPKSMVDGDIFPALVDRTADYIAIPLTSIYNSITQDHVWPTSWKVESVTPIPKKPHPETADDTRNISCTQLFSKVYESFVLTWLQKTCTLRANQYGGLKGTGTEHFLIQLWQDVLEGLDDSRAGVLLSSIDYSKAFNRLDFARCLQALKAKGVGRELLKIVASFLSGRQMRVKVGNCRSELRTVLGGVPQGSLLGVFLFNCTIDNFEAFSRDVKEYGPPPVETLTPVEVRGLPPDRPPPPTDTTRDHKHLPPFVDTPLLVQKYVDDNIVLEKINFDRTRTDGYTFRTIQAERTQNLTQLIIARAMAYGMRVNSSKTQAMLVSEVKSYIPASFFYDSDGNKISNENYMKVLGFHLSSAPDMSSQVADIKRKYRSRIWVLRHLSHRGLCAADLLRVYQSVILPCHDYCSVVYHSSLTATQSDQLERLQSQALKCIYGYEYSYRALLEISGLKSLRDRREMRCNKFALKTVNNPDYAHWFPLAENQRALRPRPPYREFPARTVRLANSPLYDLRKRLNRLTGR